MTTQDYDGRHDVVIIGSGVAGLSAGIFTARAGLDTRIVNHGESILGRNAHLENYPGYPGGVNPRTFLEMTREQARDAGCEFIDGNVDEVTETDDGFSVSFENQRHEASYVVAASWADSSYLEGVNVELEQLGSKQYVGVNSRGQTDVDGLYAAGRLAAQYHQTVVAAGHGAQVALTLIDDSDVAFYHDWVAPEGYFTGRGRDVPPGCEEIDENERKRRERESMERMRGFFQDPQAVAPTMHPSVDDDE